MKVAIKTHHKKKFNTKDPHKNIHKYKKEK